MTQQEGVKFTTKLMIALVVLQFSIIMFVYMTSSSLSVSNPQLTRLNNTEYNLNKTGNALTDSFNLTVIKQSNINCTGIFCSNALDSLSNIFAILVNGIWDIINIIYNAIVLVGLSFYILIFLLFAVIPSIFTISGLGAVGQVFEIIYSSIIVIVIVFGAYELLKLIGVIKS